MVFAGQQAPGATRNIPSSIPGKAASIMRRNGAAKRAFNQVF
jgi:hypothetical protein